MAFQDGIISLRGSIDNLTFARSINGKLIAYKKKDGVTKQRILTDHVFARTRENMEEFGRAGKASGTLKKSIRPLLQKLKDKNLNRRLISAFMKVIQEDKVSARGKRNIVDGEAELLQGFELNTNAEFEKTMLKEYTTSIDRVTGELELQIPSFIPQNEVAYPLGATHFKVISGGYSIDFENEKFDRMQTETALIELNMVATQPIILTNTIKPNSTHPLFLVAGVLFYQELNGVNYPLMQGIYNPFRVLQVKGL
jgi:hypothetical protein